ncbi:MAG: GHKL domain-containing protein [Bacteroidetes bacterium]|jgi:two-component system nitrogen regulation sensor histidine kinase NtrY|nr:GHKL domain-containing protein [Bacteroidota bacterium]MBU1578400.1 GHKL domain-containing protein [Bacteroidota bacterium]MBU2557174.1 GHKL domain-containing protein [Bacteroidota bacterium]MDA3944188.1 ATP-binding protein [Bacteroidota bacterium]
MIFRKFRFQIVVRVLLIVASSLVLGHLFQKEQYQVSVIILLLLVLLQTISLILFAEHTNNRLAKFLQGIRHADFSASFSDEGLGKSFTNLSHQFNQIIHEFKKNRAEKEEHFNYLLTVIQHVSIGIIVFRHDGKIDVFNNAIKKMLRVSHLRNISELSAVKDDLPEILLHMKAGDKNLIKIFLEDELIQVSINATEFRMRGEEYVLVSLQNIHPELEEKEIESWQRLIRVLTHEIMNSITPISSLASTVQEMMTNPETDKLELNQLNEEDLESIYSAMATIESRSRGLLNFVEIYRNLTRIPKPNFRYFAIKELFDKAHELLKPKLDKFNIKCVCKVFPEEMMLLADPDLVDQVLINLLLNAIDAVKEQENAQISITASTNLNNRITVDIADNGSGIKTDLMDKIFMPFFTSKKEGSGIGLSLSRQIMQMHKGAISVKSKPGEGTVFTLTF